ncbi:ricin-type beta-trefoil lectin domain protein, partial [Nonomuraea sp. NPDC049421]|uniref:ricin-type beta-trefoil lectin domain protein n=1 Tax=Nonomuraea sp. NPDC049421 TaxID=3155275 RepID=UPI00341627EC
MHTGNFTRLLAATAVSAATLVLTAAPASAAIRGGAQAALQAQVQGVCLDTTNSRSNNTNVRLWSCLDHPNQRWVVRGGRILVEDTVGSGREVCLDATNSRANNTNVRLWSCLDHPNQRWVVRGGRILVEDTV